MKLFILSSLFFISIISYSCITTYTPYPNESKPVGFGGILHLPLYSHQNPVELFFGTDKPKNPDYLKVGIVSVRGDSYNELVEVLRHATKRNGYDGVIDIQRNEKVYSDTSKTYIYYEMSGIGIKFKENLHYINQIPKRVDFYTINADTAKVKHELVGSTNLDLNGAIITSSNSYDSQWESLYKKTLATYSYHELVESKTGWAVSEEGVRKKYFKELEQYYYCKNIKNTIGKIIGVNIKFYDSYNQYTNVRSIKFGYSEKYKGEIADSVVIYKYDLSIKKSATKPVRLNVFTYSDVAKRKVESVLLHEWKNGKFVPTYLALYTYYNSDELEELNIR